MKQNQQTNIPIQPVEQPILCSPYEEPTEHWIYDTDTGEAKKNPGRRDAGYWYKTRQTGSLQLRFNIFQEEERDDLPLVNKLISYDDSFSVNARQLRLSYILLKYVKVANVSVLTRLSQTQTLLSW